MLKKKFLAAILCAAAALANISLAYAAQVGITDMEEPAEMATAPDISGYEEGMISPKATGSEMTQKEAVYDESPDSHSASGTMAVYASLTHHHTDSCYTQHSHTSSCYGSCTGTAQDPAFEDYGEMGELRGKGYTCSKCGRHIHTWNIDSGDTGKRKGSVCGNRTLTCTLGTSKVLVCGYTEGHNYVLSQTVQATCTSNGYYRYTCTCGAFYDTPIPATGHTTPSGYSFASNNGIENGTKYKNCTKCGARLETLYRQTVYVRYQNADGTFGGYNAERDDYRAADGSTIFGWSRAEDATYKAAALVWDDNSNIVPAYARAGYVTVYRKTLNYTVRHYQQDLNGQGYTLKDTGAFSASSGSNISPAVKTYTGFTSPVRQTKVLAAEGKTTVDYYYTRNSYTVSLNKGTGIASVTGNGTYKYGASVTINAVLAAGHSWSGWNGTHNVGDQSYTFTMPASNVTDTAKGAVINYPITYDLNGGTVKTANPATYNVTTDTFTLNNPTKTGYSFAGWTGSNGDHGEMLVSIAKGSTGDKSYTANWQANQYPVTYIDVADDVSGKELGRTVKKADYALNVRGSDLGADPADNAYHNQYCYVSDTSAAVTTDGATVYRIFQFCYTEKDSNITWDDGDDMDGLRPETYTLKLKQDGKVINEITLPSGQTGYTFSGIPKYDENGNTFDYEIEPFISDRYQVSKDEDGNIALEYQRSAFSVSIPKAITLDGRTGKADYVITVNGDFHYNDTLTVEPTASFIMKDRSSISTMQADVALAKTGFTKEDGVADGTTAEGSVQAERAYFAGLWQGSFHFEIKFEMKN